MTNFVIDNVAEIMHESKTCICFSLIIIDGENKKLLNEPSGNGQRVLCFQQDERPSQRKCELQLQWQLLQFHPACMLNLSKLHRQDSWLLEVILL